MKKSESKIIGFDEKEEILIDMWPHPMAEQGGYKKLVRLENKKY